MEKDKKCNQIEALKKCFVGKGEVKDFEFNANRIGTVSYMYSVTDSYGNEHYEVFKRKNTPICIVFDKRIYSDTDAKEVYPKSKDFGVWAWTYKSYKDAFEKWNELESV